MHTQYIRYLWFIVLLTAALFLTSASPVGASNQPALHTQAGSASDLIAAVNSYRSSNGLEPYATDGGLMSLAQSHSEYIAQVESCTHTRADGSGPGDYGISAENVACGLNLSVQDAISYQWADPLHSSTILGPTTGLVGAGVATNGSTVYYTLAVKRLSGDFEYRPPVQPADPSSSGSTQDNPLSSGPLSSGDEQISPIATNTPNADGSISHTLKYGETLVQIAAAYGVPLVELIGINNLDPAQPVYYEGQTILVRLANTATPVVTATNTPRPATRTPLPTRTPRPTRTATEVRTPLPTFTATPEPLVQIPTLEDLGPARSLLAYTFIAISAVGLIVLIWSSFWPGRKG